METKNWEFVKVFESATERAKNLQQGAVISRSCIDCINCKCLSGKSGITFVCLLARYGELTTQKKIEEIRTLRCEKYVAENGC